MATKMKNSVTERLLSALTARIGKQKLSQEIDFLRTYYHRLSGQDYSEKHAEEFRASALKHKKLGRVRQPGETLIDIYNHRISATNQTAGNDATGNEIIETTVIDIVTEDKPFIINSMVMKLNNLRKTPQRLLHPIFSVNRNAIVVEYTPKDEHASLLHALCDVIFDIHIVVKDWKRMRQKVGQLAEIIRTSRKGPVFAEYGELFDWMADDHFAFLGYCELEIGAAKNRPQTRLVPRSALGVLRAARSNQKENILDILPPIASSPTSPVIFTKTRKQAAIHRSNYMDCILFDHDFEPSSKPPGRKRPGKRTVSCILGFLSGSSAMQPTPAIPHLRKKTAYVLEQSGLRRAGYAYKELRTILETLPREKLFQMDIKSLYGLCMTLLNQQERRKTRLHLHKNICQHFYSCLVYVPRDLFNSDLRQRIQSYLGRQLGADEVSFKVYFSDSILTRIHYTIHCDTRSNLDINPSHLEKAVQDMAKDWNDNLYEALRPIHGNERAKQAVERFFNGFSSGYQDDFNVKDAVVDLEIFAHLQKDGIHAVLGRSHQEPRTGTKITRASFKLYSSGQSLHLSDVLPILENMGVKVLEESPYRITAVNGDVFTIHDFEIVRRDGKLFDLKADSTNFESTFIRCAGSIVENDGYNRLTLVCGLNWRQVALLRAYFKYLKQIRLRYSENYIIEALASNPKLVISIVNLFDEKFNPGLENRTTGKISSSIKRRMEQVKTLDEDRIISALLDVISATLRTNYFQNDRDGKPKSYISFKLDSGSIPRIPEPCPKFEIFVYSPRVEGVHLRGGEVARGGLRWSERPEDFRTEVLGLVKAQRVKNAVIVPVGSKGGFVAKQLPDGDRQTIIEEVIACYRIFISSLLDLTDNLSGTQIIPPDNVVRHDGDDPYLVVAADKGTATFSDIANGISNDYGFWLGDAFASGGSAGYDHKKMGITARGAWESVKRHFRELGKDIQSTDFTVVGIGDMGGDVFGNGMLLSKHIRLIAAFNHIHIFIDPNPDAAVSYKERRRLFALPGSTWGDYDKRLISAGGGVYDRSAKSITLSDEAMAALGTLQNQLAPNDLINTILKSEVELLWNGGIGTYVKASSETHSDAQDRNNDSLRVNANELRCRVIGEGGNLGITQLARIEFSQHGGLCYTDAIDNSAGVDTSDHEVNLKILLNAAMESGALKIKQRNAMLARMEEEIAALVLRNNYVQTQILGIEAFFGKKFVAQQARAINLLEGRGLLNRALEYLPPDEVLKERIETEKPLTRPELAVLLSYSKMDLYRGLLGSELPDCDYLTKEIMEYFPALMAKKYPDLISGHQLKREIISTQITNDLVGVMGPCFHLRLGALTGSGADGITRAYICARDILSVNEVNRQIESLDNKIDASLQMECLTRCAAAVESAVVWLLRGDPGQSDIKTTVDRFAPPYRQLCRQLGMSSVAGISHSFQTVTTAYMDKGIPRHLAKTIAAMSMMPHALDIIDIAKRINQPEQTVLDAYFQLSAELGLFWLQESIANLPVTSSWHEKAQFSLANDLRVLHTEIVHSALKTTQSPAHALQKWSKNNRSVIRYIKGMSENLREEPHADFAMLSVLVSELSRLR